MIEVRLRRARAEGSRKSLYRASAGVPRTHRETQFSSRRAARPSVDEKELQKLYKNFSKIDKDKSGMLEPSELFDIPGKCVSLPLNFVRARAEPSG